MEFGYKPWLHTDLPQPIGTPLPLNHLMLAEVSPPRHRYSAPPVGPFESELRKLRLKVEKNESELVNTQQGVREVGAVVRDGLLATQIPTEIEQRLIEWQQAAITAQRELAVETERVRGLEVQLRDLRLHLRELTQHKQHEKPAAAAASDQAGHSLEELANKVRALDAVGKVRFCTALGREERAALLAAMAACEAAKPMPVAAVERNLNTSNRQARHSVSEQQPSQQQPVQEQQQMTQYRQNREWIDQVAQMSEQRPGAATSMGTMQHHGVSSYQMNENKQLQRQMQQLQQQQQQLQQQIKFESSKESHGAGTAHLMDAIEDRCLRSEAHTIDEENGAIKKRIMHLVDRLDSQLQVGGAEASHTSGNRVSSTRGSNYNDTSNRGSSQRIRR